MAVAAACLWAIYNYSAVLYSALALAVQYNIKYYYTHWQCEVKIVLGSASPSQPRSYELHMSPI